jgi:hypothetical protein
MLPLAHGWHARHLVVRRGITLHSINLLLDLRLTVILPDRQSQARSFFPSGR